MTLWVVPFPPDAWRELRLSPAVVRVPWAYSLYALADSGIRRLRAA